VAGPIDWLFRSRQTGRITIAQVPNVALAVFLVASALRRFLDPDGGLDTGLKLAATGALIWWAVDELLRGVNPWRRLLGGFVMAVHVASLVA
jgi:hypothetical protein